MSPGIEATLCMSLSWPWCPFDRCQTVITRDGPIMDLKRCCRFQMQLLPARNTHGAQARAKCVQIWADSLLFTALMI